MAAKSPAAEAFRLNVSQLMDQLGLSITQVAKLTGISRAGLHRILAGAEGITIIRGERIAQVLGVSLPLLLTPNGVPKKVRQTA